jgi:hypothetical protein
MGTDTRLTVSLPCSRASQDVAGSAPTVREEGAALRTSVLLEPASGTTARGEVARGRRRVVDWLDDLGGNLKDVHPIDVYRGRDLGRARSGRWWSGVLVRGLTSVAGREEYAARC